MTVGFSVPIINQDGVAQAKIVRDFLRRKKACDPYAVSKTEGLGFLLKARLVGASARDEKPRLGVMGEEYLKR